MRWLTISPGEVCPGSNGHRETGSALTALRLHYHTIAAAGDRHSQFIAAFSVTEAYIRLRYDLHIHLHLVRGVALTADPITD